MRKQTKIAAIVSAAALLAVGASMTSFAATGWQEENGTWVYYNKDGEYVTNSWQKSGDNYFYLDDDGLMAVDSLIEDDENYYYVDSNGAMVTNQWIAIDNENYGDDDQPEVHWYYFQANGKAYKRSSTATTPQLKTINGKKYTFNEYGQMLYGWIDSSNAGETDHGADAYTRCEYYFGGENDGAMTVGWIEIDLTEVADAETEQPGDAYWEADQTRWFYFKSSGKKVTSTTNQPINGRRYGFDEHGRMIASWYATWDTTSDESTRKGQTAITHATTSDFLYFSTPEDGARYTKGWFKVVPGVNLNQSAYESGTAYWYYADGKGNIYASAIKSIGGKKYAFGPKGNMLSGFQMLTVDENGKIYSNPETKEVTKNGKKTKYTLGYDTEEQFLNTVEALGTDLTVGVKKQLIEGDANSTVTQTTTFYYFSGDADTDGSMKTGKYTITIDDADYTFNFQKNGQAYHGYNKSDKKIYVGGMLLKANSDNKVEIVVEKSGMFFKMSIEDFLKDAQNLDYTLPTTGDIDSKNDTTTYTIAKQSGYQFYVINTSGTHSTSLKKDAEGFKAKGESDFSTLTIVKPNN